MSDGVNAGSGGGIHPGQPIIWPTTKESKKVQQTQQAQQAGKATTVPAQSAKESAVTEQVAQKAQQAQQAAKPTVARALSKTDISAQLVQMGLPASKENVQLANKMLLHGLELSSENFNAVFKMLKGKGANSVSQQSALVALSKGLEEQQGAVKSLESFFSKNPQITKQMQMMQTNLNALKSTILGGRSLLSSQLTNQLLEMLGVLSDKYKKMLKGEMGKDNLSAKMMRNGLVKEMGALKSLLMGMAKQLSQTQNQELAKAAKQLAKQFAGVGKQAEDLMQNLLAQSILSKPEVRQDNALPDKYAYWQLPNALAKNPKSIELLVKRDQSKKNKSINPEKTRLIIKLETDELGEITIMVDVEEKKVWYIFNNESDAAKDFVIKNSIMLKERMDQLDWNVQGIQAIRRKVDIKKYLIPTISMESLKRVSTEA